MLKQSKSDVYAEMTVWVAERHLACLRDVEALPLGDARKTQSLKWADDTSKALDALFKKYGIPE